MFDIGFSELVVIALVALVVIGPERLPRVARTVGALLGRAQRYVNEVKADIQREVDLGELKNISSTFQDAAKSVEQSVSQFSQEMQQVGDTLNQSVSAAVGSGNEARAPEAATAAHSGPESEQLDLELDHKPKPERVAAPKA